MMGLHDLISTVGSLLPEVATDVESIVVSFGVSCNICKSECGW